MKTNWKEKKEKEFNKLFITYKKDGKQHDVAKYGSEGVWQFAVDMAEEARVNELKMNNEQRVLNLIKQYGGIDGGYHKQWVLDHLVRMQTIMRNG